ncbi:MAG: hypothetical protein LBM99_05515 [Bacillales bacterium]|jgi:hypothetical protein|nr:hypothetical protein [Bacillales bacterium]
MNKTNYQQNYELILKVLKEKSLPIEDLRIEFNKNYPKRDLNAPLNELIIYKLITVENDLVSLTEPGSIFLIDNKNSKLIHEKKPNIFNKALETIKEKLKHKKKSKLVFLVSLISYLLLITIVLTVFLINIASKQKAIPDKYLNVPLLLNSFESNESNSDNYKSFISDFKEFNEIVNSFNLPSLKQLALEKQKDNSFLYLKSLIKYQIKNDEFSIERETDILTISINTYYQLDYYGTSLNYSFIVDENNYTFTTDNKTYNLKKNINSILLKTNNAFVVKGSDKFAEIDFNYEEYDFDNLFISYTPFEKYNHIYKLSSFDTLGISMSGDMYIEYKNIKHHIFATFIEDAQYIYMAVLINDDIDNFYLLYVEEFKLGDLVAK